MPQVNCATWLWRVIPNGWPPYTAISSLQQQEMAQHLQRQSIRSPPPSDEKGVALFPLRRFSDDERRREEYFAGAERGVAHSLRERGERGFGDAVARLAYRRELSGTPSNTSVETPQNSSMRPPPIET